MDPLQRTLLLLSDVLHIKAISQIYVYHFDKDNTVRNSAAAAGLPVCAAPGAARQQCVNSQPHHHRACCHYQINTFVLSFLNLPNILFLFEAHSTYTFTVCIYTYRYSHAYPCTRIHVYIWHICMSEGWGPSWWMFNVQSWVQPHEYPYCAA